MTCEVCNLRAVWLWQPRELPIVTHLCDTHAADKDLAELEEL